MGSVAYLRDPTDGTTLTNVVKAHARYTVQSVKLLAKVQTQLYDKYEQQDQHYGCQTLPACLTLNQIEQQGN